MRRYENGLLAYYRFDSWPDLKHGIFTRNGGVSHAPWSSLNLGGNVGDEAGAVRENHERIYDVLNLNAGRVCTVWQVHGADIMVAEGPIQGRRWIGQADALITDKPDTPLMMRFADCTPLMFYDPIRGVIGMAHAGWRGTVQGVGANTVRAMVQAYDCRPEDIQIGIGPSIGPNHFQVGDEVVIAVQDYFGTTDGLVRRDPFDGTAYVDLWAANALDLRRTGVEQIEMARICTVERTDEFFSHRAEKGRTGRFGAILSL